MKKLLLILISILFFSCEKEIEYVPIPQRPIPIEYMNSYENEIILINNQHRQELGLPEYKTSLDLYHIARERVYYMAERDSLSHDGFYPGYIKSGALFYGESISYNYITAQANINGFYSSVNHYPMFISPIYEYIAVAYYQKYTVVLVARYRPYNINNN